MAVFSLSTQLKIYSKDMKPSSGLKRDLDLKENGRSRNKSISSETSSD